MRALASYIGDIDDYRPGKFVLDSEAPLLCVRPDRLRRNRGNIERKDGTGRRYSSADRARASGVSGVERGTVTDIANTRIVDWKRLGHAKDYGCAGLERSGIRFIARAVLKKD